MSMVFCRGCGKEIHETALFCPQCGNPQGIAPTKVKLPYASYDQVPWYRKNWFALLCGISFTPALLPTLMTGNVYYERKGQLRTYSMSARIFLILYIFASITFVAFSSWKYMKENSIPAQQYTGGQSTTPITSTPNPTTNKPLAAHQIQPTPTASTQIDINDPANAGRTVCDAQGQCVTLASAPAIEAMNRVDIEDAAAKAHAHANYSLDTTPADASTHKAAGPIRDMTCPEQIARFTQYLSKNDQSHLLDNTPLAERCALVTGYLANRMELLDESYNKSSNLLFDVSVLCLIDTINHDCSRIPATMSSMELDSKVNQTAPMYLGDEVYPGQFSNYSSTPVNPLTANDIEHVVGISVNAIHEYAQSGRLPSRTAFLQMRYTMQFLEKYANAHGNNSYYSWVLAKATPDWQVLSMQFTNYICNHQDQSKGDTNPVNNSCDW